MTEDRRMSHIFRRRKRGADDPVGISDMTPVDLAAVQVDDALLNRLAVMDDEELDAWLWDVDDAVLHAVLVAARREVDTEAIGPLVDIDTAVAAIRAAHKLTRQRRLALSVVAAVLAALVIAFGVAGVVALGSEPGDRLHPLCVDLYGAGQCASPSPAGVR